MTSQSTGQPAGQSPHKASPGHPGSHQRHDARRLNLLLFPRFQLTLIGINLLILILMASVIWIEMSRSFSDLASVGGMAGPGAEYFKEYLGYQISKLQQSMLISLILGVVVCVFMTLLLSWRFVGPLVNLRRFFETIVRGTKPTPKLQFRQGDYLDDLPPLVNRAVETLEKGTST